MSSDDKRTQKDRSFMRNIASSALGRAVVEFGMYIMSLFSG